MSHWILVKIIKQNGKIPNQTTVNWNKMESLLDAKDTIPYYTKDHQRMRF